MEANWFGQFTSNMSGFSDFEQMKYLVGDEDWSINWDPWIPPWLCLQWPLDFPLFETGAPLLGSFSPRALVSSPSTLLACTLSLLSLLKMILRVCHLRLSAPPFLEIFLLFMSVQPFDSFPNSPNSLTPIQASATSFPYSSLLNINIWQLVPLIPVLLSLYIFSSGDLIHFYNFNSYYSTGCNQHFPSFPYARHCSRFNSYGCEQKRPTSCSHGVYF